MAPNTVNTSDTTPFSGKVVQIATPVTDSTIATTDATKNTAPVTGNTLTLSDTNPNDTHTVPSTNVSGGRPIPRWTPPYQNKKHRGQHAGAFGKSKFKG